MEDKEDQIEAGPSRLAGGRFNKEGNLLRRLVSCGGQTNGSPNRRPESEVYIEAYTWFSHVFRPGGVNTYSLKVLTLKQFLGS